MCLANVIEKVPQASMVQASQAILSQAHSQQGETRLVTALSRLVRWLGMWPAKQLHIFVLDILVKLAKDRVSVLKAVAEANVIMIAKQLTIPVFRAQLVDIFMFLVYGHQHSQSMFVKLVAELPTILATLQREGVTGRITWDKLTEVVRYLHDLHHTVPASLVEPVLVAVEGGVQVEEERRTELGKKAWGCLDSAGVEVVTGGGRDEIVQTKAVGLINLGNTCYMNSVIQALYYTTRFRSLVLASTPGHNQPVLASLQQAFTFLRYSMRNIYSPSEFLRIARPPWFESGRQQDCSEFLTYLLDTLQEEERAAMPVITEDILENQAMASEILEDKDTIMNNSEEKCDEVNHQHENDDNQTKGEEYGEARDLVEAPAVEDSLSVTSGKRLSRGSRGSLGLSRWSTEENLSIGDSREVLNTGGSKEMLNISSTLPESGPSTCTRTCLDSHSSSSDSGIQSVGSHTPEEDDPSTPVSMVHKMFGGRMETCFTCQSCYNTSTFKDWFTDLHLAIPQASVADSGLPNNQKILAQKETLKRAFNEMNSTSSSQTKANDDIESDNAIKPNENIPTENPSITITPPSTTLSVGDLVQHYLAPELLSGGNQYQCDHCNMLRDAVKSTKLSSAPDYLNITLLRFKYDRTTNRRAKVFTTIDYPQELCLPVVGGSVTYKLYSVVIHSGYSSDGGHYYTWCSNPATSAWLLLNDSQVSQSTWTQFRQQTSKLSRDTAYLLFYERVGAPDGEDVIPHRLAMDKVIRDNMKYIREKENVGVRFQSPPDSDRRDDRGSGGGDGSSSGCNENFGQFGGGRCVF